MPSIGEVKKRLPDDFIDSLYDYFSPGTVDRILMGMSAERQTTLRVNSIKFDIHRLMEYFKEINIKFERIPWYSDGLIIKNARERDIEKLDIYKKGFIYLQSQSSMVPPVILSPREGEKVLDLTAAPGSKTTQMAALMNNRGLIMANEIDSIRAERLKYNVELLGADIVQVSVGKGEKIGDEYPEYFDKVLLDTPCSGEGRFLICDVSTYRSWSLREVHRLSNLQKKLFLSAYKALRRDGILVYSTCTLNLAENEQVIDWVVNNLGFNILDINLNMNGIIKGISDNFNKSLSNAVRILPSKEAEGFFICKLRKTE